MDVGPHIHVMSLLVFDSPVGTNMLPKTRRLIKIVPYGEIAQKVCEANSGRSIGKYVIVHGGSFERRDGRICGIFGLSQGLLRWCRWKRVSGIPEWSLLLVDLASASSLQRLATVEQLLRSERVLLYVFPREHRPDDSGGLVEHDCCRRRRMAFP